MSSWTAPDLRFAPRAEAHSHTRPALQRAKFGPVGERADQRQPDAGGRAPVGPALNTVAPVLDTRLDRRLAGSQRHDQRSPLVAVGVQHDVVAGFADRGLYILDQRPVDG